MSGADKRAHPRIDVRIPVTLHFDDKEIKGVVEDISLGGASIRCEALPPTGANLRMSLHFSGLRSALGAVIDVDRITDTAMIQADEIAEVRWGKDQTKFGIRFKGLSRKTRKFLAELIEVFEEIRATGL